MVSMQLEAVCWGGDETCGVEQGVIISWEGSAMCLQVTGIYHTRKVECCGWELPAHMFLPAVLSLAIPDRFVVLPSCCSMSISSCQPGTRPALLELTDLALHSFSVLMITSYLVGVRPTERAHMGYLSLANGQVLRGTDIRFSLAAQALQGTGAALNELY